MRLELIANGLWSHIDLGYCKSKESKAQIEADWKVFEETGESPALTRNTVEASIVAQVNELGVFIPPGIDDISAYLKNDFFARSEILWKAGTTPTILVVMHDPGDPRSAKKAWDILAEMYEPRGGSKLFETVLTSNELYSSQYKDGTSMDDYLLHINGLRFKLEELGRPLEEGHFAIFLLLSLPKSWEHIIHKHLYRDHIDEAHLIADIKAEVKRRDDKKSLNKGLRSEFKCYYCHRPGHFRRDCPTRKQVESSRKARRPSSTKFW